MAGNEHQPLEMKLGEYFLHVYLEEASQLAIPEGKRTNVGLRLKAFGEVKYSDERENLTGDSEVFLGDHHFFVKIFESREELENEELEVTVISKGLLTSSEIGSVSLNLSSIYFEDCHTVKHRWFVLQHKAADDFQEAKGYVKLSVSMSADDDEKVRSDHSGRVGTRRL